MKKPTLKEVIIAALPIITGITGYQFYEPIQELKSPPADVNIELTVPESNEHTHKNWLPVIRQEIEKAQRAHISEEH